MARYQVREYLLDGESLYRPWLVGLDKAVRARIQARVQRFEEGNLGKGRHFGAGLHEAILDFGPGYRLYYGLLGDTVVVLLCGGSKSGQQRDLERAKVCWRDYLEEKGHA
jgi:putative addiction module killer protein